MNSSDACCTCATACPTTAAAAFAAATAAAGSLLLDPAVAFAKAAVDRTGSSSEEDAVPAVSRNCVAHDKARVRISPEELTAQTAFTRAL